MTDKTADLMSSDINIKIIISGPGKDGDTPVRGKDYWTEEDQQVIYDYIREEKTRQFVPDWGMNIYGTRSMDEVLPKLRHAVELNMTRIIACVNFMEIGENFYGPYNYVTSYQYLTQTLEQAALLGLTTSAIKVHLYNVEYSNMDRAKYIAGIAKLIEVLKECSMRPEYIIVLNETNLTDSSSNTEWILRVIQMVHDGGYKCGMSMYGNFQYVSKTSIDILNALDVIGLNYYQAISPVGDNTCAMDSMRAWEYSGLNEMLACIKHICGKPIWITETGVFDNMSALINPGNSWSCDYEEGNGVAEAIYFIGAFEYLKSNTDIECVFGWDPQSLYKPSMIKLCKKYMRGDGA